MAQKVYLISYDLITPGQKYQKLAEAIKSFPNWAKLLESVWAVQSSYSAEQVRNHLKSFIDSNDKLIVMSLDREAAWFNLPDEVTKWLQANL